MTSNYKIHSNGEATVNNTFLKVRIGMKDGNRYFYIPENRAQNQDYKKLEDCPNSLYVNHDQLIQKMIELSK